MSSVRNSRATAGAPLALTTLGGASLHCGTELTLGPGKPLALVTYLALAPGRGATRDFLLDLLWADLDRDRARHALRQTIWQLRQTFGESGITGREELTLALSIDADRDRFVAAIAAGDPERAISLYRGPFLPAFALPGSSAFEHWADTERSRLHSMFLRAAETVARRRLAAGRFRDAQETARRIRDADRSSEIGWRLLIEAFIAAEDLLQAAVEVDGLLAQLRGDGREPEPATRSLLSALRTAQGEGAGNGDRQPRGLVADLIGREREFAGLLDAWGAAARGTPQHVHLSAPAGLGKTRLLADFGHRLRTLGARMLRLRAHPGERNVSYAFIGDLAQALAPLSGLAAISPGSADALVGLSPGLSSRFPNARPARHLAELLRLRTVALAEAIGSVAFEQPTALLIDDVHWADAESRQVLDGILHRLEKVPLLVVTAGRPSAGRSVAGQGTTTLELKPLSAGDVTALISGLGRMPDLEAAERMGQLLHRSTGGSPFLVLEALQLGIERNTVTLADGVWQIPSFEALVAELDHGRAVAGRLHQLEAGDRWVLLLLAVAGTPLSAPELGLLLRTPDSIDDHLWSLERRALVLRTAKAWEPAHDQIADAAEEIATPEQRRAAHRAIGGFLAADRHARVDTLIVACRHLAAANADDEVRRVFRLAAEGARLAGDRRSNRDLALAISVDRPDLVPRLLRALPWSTRIGLHSRPRQTAALVGGFLLVAAGARLLSGADEAPVAALSVITADPDLPSALVESRVEIPAGPWKAGEELVVPDRGVRFSDVEAQRQTTSVGDGSLLITRFVDNVRTDDIFRRQGRDVRLFEGGDRDDHTPAVSPSGRRVGFVTARWSARGADDYDIGIRDLTDSSTVTRLTATSDWDGTPSWSPTGALVAFMRRPTTLDPVEVCWVTPRAESPVERCRPVEYEVFNGIAGWLDPETVGLLVTDGPAAHLVGWNIARDRFDVRWTWRTMESASIAPDGRWLTCFCASVGAATRGWSVVPLEAPAAARPLSTKRTIVAAAWLRAPADDHVLRIVGQPTLQVGSTWQPAATLTDGVRHDRWHPAEAVLWRMDDTTIATFEPSTGLVRGRTPGRTILHAILTDELRDSLAVTVTADTAVTVFHERWERLDTTRWLPFGAPSPRLARAIDGTPGLNSGGDGSYESGVFSSATWTPVSGFGIEAAVSLPITRSQWQLQVIGLIADQEAAVAGWDRRTGTYPKGAQWIDAQCQLGYPGSEGLPGIGRVAFSGGGEPAVYHRVDSTWRLGGWHRIRLQIFPDGTCGYAIDGAPVQRSSARLPVDMPYRVWLSGNSADTDRLIVGPLTVWLGVRDDVDWTAPSRQ